MRIIFLLLMTTLVINAKTLGVVIVNNNTINYDNSIKKKLEQLYLTQDENFLGTNNINVSIDTDMKIEKIYKQLGTEGIIEYAIQKKYASIALVKYKKRTRYLSVIVIVADKKVQDRKSLSIPFTPDLGDELVKTILSAVLTLNFELGVLNATTIY